MSSKERVPTKYTRLGMGLVTQLFRKQFRVTRFRYDAVGTNDSLYLSITGGGKVARVIGLLHEQIVVHQPSSLPYGGTFYSTAFLWITGRLSKER